MNVQIAEESKQGWKVYSEVDQRRASKEASGDKLILNPVLSMGWIDDL